MVPSSAEDALEPDPQVGDEAVAAPMPSGPVTEQDLVALYPTWAPRLQRFFVASGCTPAQAHELTQDSFAAALRGLAGFRGEARLSTWLWQIARHVLLAERRRAPPPEPLTDELEAAEALRVFEAPHLSVQGDCVRRGFARFAAEHPERAHAIYLAYVEGWTRAELAEALGRSEHATTVYLAECRAKFKPFVQDCDDDC